MNNANQKNVRRVRFCTHAPPNSDVYLVGTFNDWNTDSIPMCDCTGKGHYQVDVPLTKGDYEYKFIVNGNWCPDVTSQYWVENAFGSTNSLIKV